MLFYLGTDEPAWLKTSNVPLFISRNRFTSNKTSLKANCDWALDSGAFTELSSYGTWRLQVKDFSDQVERLTEIGRLKFCSPQDWMCEPHIIYKTGLNVLEHQKRTVGNFLELTSYNKYIPWIPVLQGWTTDDYLIHLAMYKQNGIDLTTKELVGVGSVCRRDVYFASKIINLLYEQQIKIHGYGLKLACLKRVKTKLESSDSMAWSYYARRRNKLCSSGAHDRCNHCKEFALMWRDKICASL